MEKIKTPLTVLIEKEENILRRYEALKFDDATIQVQKGFIGRLQEQLPTEREVIEKAHRKGQRDQGQINEQWTKDYFTQTFNSYE